MQSKIFQEYDIMDEDQDHVKRKGKLNEVRRYCKVQSIDYTTLWSIGSWWWCQILSASSGLLPACFLGWTQEYLCWFKTANRARVGLNVFAHARQKMSYQIIPRRGKGKSCVVKDLRVATYRRHWARAERTDLACWCICLAGQFLEYKNLPSKMKGKLYKEKA